MYFNSTSVILWPWAAVADLKALCSGISTFRFIRFSFVTSTFLISLTSPQGSEFICHMSTDASSFLPGELGEVDHGDHLVEADSERIGHGPEPGRIDHDIAVFDGRPLGRLHTGRLSGLLDGTCGELPNILDHDAGTIGRPAC